MGSDTINRRKKLVSVSPNGVIVNTGYDNADELTSLSCLQADGVTQIGNLTYTYDAAGRRINMGGSQAASNLPQAMTAEYDANNRLNSLRAGSTTMTTTATCSSTAPSSTPGTPATSWRLIPTTPRPSPTTVMAA